MTPSSNNATHYISYLLLRIELPIGTLHASYKAGVRMYRSAWSWHENRIAPVFDTADTLLVVNSERDKEIDRWFVHISIGSPEGKALCVASHHVDLLVCGAISRFYEAMVVQQGIAIIPFVRGNVDELIAQWLAGAPLVPANAMPGCCRRYTIPRTRRNRYAEKRWNRP